MTTLREAAMRQALEALEIGYDAAKAEADQYHSAMAGYRPKRHAKMDADVQQIAAAITAIKAALTEPVQEPVAWRFQSAVGGWAYSSRPPLGSKYPAHPLYAAPPQRKPTVTDLQEALADVALIDRAAIDDPEEYDGGATIAQIAVLHSEMFGEQT